MFMIEEAIANTARQCRHYSMCKVDFLGTGLCPAGVKHAFASYWPQGRMDIVRALADGKLLFTPALERIADSCDLCGVCDRQCHFVTELRPLGVMRALKTHVEDCRHAGVQGQPPPDDLLILQLCNALAPERVSNVLPTSLLTAMTPGHIPSE